MTVMPPSLRSAIEPFHAMDVLARANAKVREGASVVSLAVGQPSAPAPLPVREAAARATRDGPIGYTDALGRGELRDVIAAHYADHYGVAVPADRIAVTTGSSAGFALAFLAMFDPGDRIVIERPGYPAYRNIMRVLGLRVVEVDRLDAETLGAVHREGPVRGLLIASPANPTGTVIDPARFEALLRIAAEHGVRVISDEIYHRLTYGGIADRTALKFDETAVVINSFSKYYCMTGWRIGWMVLPADLVRPVERIAQSLYISAPDASQIGAVHAFDATDELDRVRATYAANRDALLDVLPSLGFRLAARADGAFYAWCDVSALTNDAKAFSHRMLDEAGVAAPSGHDFDPENGDRTMRLSYAGSPADIEEAIHRLRRWVS